MTGMRSQRRATRALCAIMAAVVVLLGFPTDVLIFASQSLPSGELPLKSGATRLEWASSGTINAEYVLIFNGGAAGSKQSTGELTGLAARQARMARTACAGGRPAA